MKLKKKKSIINKILIIIFIIILLLLFLLYFISNKLMPLLMIYSENIVKEKGVNIISNNINDKIINDIDDDFFKVIRDNSGKIESIDYNTKTINKVLSDISLIVTNNFKEYHEKNNGIITRIPITSITNNVFLESYGPRIPIKLELDGNIFTSIDIKVKEYGYDSALIEVSVKVEANVLITIPFISKKEKLVNYIPISIKIIKGNTNSLFDNKIIKKQ